MCKIQSRSQKKKTYNHSKDLNIFVSLKVKMHLVLYYLVDTFNVILSKTHLWDRGRKMCFSVQTPLVMCFFWLSNL